MKPLWFCAAAATVIPVTARFAKPDFATFALLKKQSALAHPAVGMADWQRHAASARLAPVQLRNDLIHSGQDLFNHVAREDDFRAFKNSAQAI